jgi:hypothetical protein
MLLFIMKNDIIKTHMYNLTYTVCEHLNGHMILTQNGHMILTQSLN